MHPLKIAVRLASFRMPVKKAVVAAAETGADGVEIDARGEIRPGQLSQTGLRQFRHLLDDLRIGVAAVEFRARDAYHVTKNLERRVEATKAAMAFAHALGATVVVGRLGPIPPETAAEDWNTLLAVLHDLGAYGHHVGAVFAVETGNTPADDLARVFAALADGTLSIALNPAALLVAGFSPGEFLARFGTQIVHVRAQDAVRDLGAGGCSETQLGRGSVDFPALFGALEELRYRGFVTAVRDRAADPQLEITQAVQFLRNL